MSDIALTVTEFNRMVRDTLEESFGVISLQGEISQFKTDSMGKNWYFTVKDERSSVNVVMFANRNSEVGFMPAPGDLVLLVGTASLYERTGSFSFNATLMKKAGLGTLLEKIRLNAEAWKDTYFARPKRPVPANVRNLFVVTSPKGKVIGDIIRTRNMRDGRTDIYVIPSVVQGEYCAESVSKAVRYANRVLGNLVAAGGPMSEAINFENTCLVVARGGGTFEDTLPFNDEIVVKSFSESKLVIISAVGHDADSPLCDRAADARASTPTQAVEMALTDFEGEKRVFCKTRDSFERAFRRMCESERYALDSLRMNFESGSKLFVQRTLAGFLSVKERFLSQKALFAAGRRNDLEKLRNALADSLRRKAMASEFRASRARADIARMRSDLQTRLEDRAERERNRLDFLKKRLASLSPDNVLDRGYALVMDASGNAVDSAYGVKPGEIGIRFRDGTADIGVEKVTVRNAGKP